MFLFHISDILKKDEYNFFELDSYMLNDKKCAVDHINYTESTIFHHNFVETKLDSSTYGFFFNKKYPAIMTKVFLKQEIFCF